MSSSLVRLLAIALLAPCALACRKSKPPAATDPLAPPAAVGSLALPEAKVGATPEQVEGEARVYATASALFLGDQRIGDGPEKNEGFKARDRRTSGSLEIVELARRLQGRERALLYVDGGLSGRALTEIAFTHTIAGGKRDDLAIATKEGVRVIPLDLSPSRRPCPAPSSSASAAPGCDPGLAIALLVMKDGVVAVARGQRLGDGCKAPGGELSVHGYDATAIRACVDEIRSHAGDGGDRTLTIAPSAMVTVRDVVDVIEAARADAKGNVVFSTIRLGVL
jgi:hypothetical protein